MQALFSGLSFQIRSPFEVLFKTENYFFIGQFCDQATERGQDLVNIDVKKHHSEGKNVLEYTII